MQIPVNEVHTNDGLIWTWELVNVKSAKINNRPEFLPSNWAEYASVYFKNAAQFSPHSPCTGLQVDVRAANDKNRLCYQDWWECPLSTSAFLTQRLYFFRS